MKIIPIGTKILVEKLPHAEEIKGCIILRDRPDNYLGTIQSIGEGVTLKGINIGNIVRYTPYGITVVDVDNPQFILIDEKDVIAVVEL